MLRKTYFEQQRLSAAELAATNAASLRAALERQAEARAILAAPAAAPLPAACGLPAAAERGAGVAPFEEVRAAVDRLRRQRHAAPTATNPAPGLSISGAGLGGEGDDDMLDAASVDDGGGEEEEVDEEEGGNPRSVRPVPAQRLDKTKATQNIVGGKGVPLQVGKWSQALVACWLLEGWHCWS